jgi:hypothetical protein
MANSENEDLLRSARSLLDRFMFQSDERHDDAANRCGKTDEALRPPAAASLAETLTE